METNAYLFFVFDGFIYIASHLNQLDMWFTEGRNDDTTVEKN